jgi:murein DD-endopeptidase MepM/ murein hydrolase activator NlpD
MGGVTRARRGCACALALALAACGSFTSCATGSTGSREHVVERGENLYRIALRYGVSVDEIVAENHLEDPARVPVGTRLKIPGQGAAESEEGDSTGEGAAPPAATGRTCGAPDELRRMSQRKARTEGDLTFEWPARGNLSTCFGERHSRPHEGIDIRLPEGTRIHAAEAGKVIYSGRMGAYGKVVIVKHAGTWASVYAHNSANVVDEGEFVERGEVIAESGETGNATGPHLHFEIRRSERPEDPLLYLP